MMGLPEGWTEGLKRTQALKALGNAVVPQVAALAWDILTSADRIIPGETTCLPLVRHPLGPAQAHLPPLQDGVDLGVVRRGS